MKTFKKLGSLAIALALVLSTMLVSASAANVTIGNASSGATYTAYKIFDIASYADKDSSGTINAGDPILYPISESSAWYDTVSAYGGLSLTDTSTPGVDYVKATGSFNQAAFAAQLVGDGSKPDPVATIVESGSDVTFGGLENGYYLVTSTAGGNPLLFNVTTNNRMDIVEKNALPILTKTVQENSDSSWGAGNTAAIGDTVNFKVTVQCEAGAQNYVITDTLSAGFVSPTNIAVTYEGNPLSADTYTLTNSGNVITIEFTSEFLNTVAVNSEIEVTYEAVLDTDATHGSDHPNTNTAVLNYGTGMSRTDSTNTYTFKNIVNKVDQTDAALAGAGFTLYKHNGSDYVVVGTEKTGGTEFTWEGLDVGQYKLEETTVPAGYNKAEDVLFTITATVTSEGTLTAVTSSNDDVSTAVDTGIWSTTVVNTTGTVLPETGGIGTTIFYTVGGLLVAGAGILLITKKRMSAEQ